MIRFIEWPWALALVLVLPMLGVVALTVERRSRARRLAALGTREMLGRLAPFTVGRGVWRTMRIMLALTLFGCALAGPRWGVEQTVVRKSGVDVVIAVDASLSMTAPDETPSRLAKAKQTIQQLRALSPNDRFALLAFAGKSYILTPLTTDDAALSLYLDNLDPTVVGTAGSSLASAIRQGTSLLSLGQVIQDRAIVLLSDGEGFEPPDELASVAKHAGEVGIALVTVGFGTARGTTIPIRENGRQTLKRDEYGQVVVTKYSPVLLQQAAQSAQGVFVPATATNKASLIRHVLDGLKTQPRGIMTGQNLSPQFVWFVAPALLVLLLDSLLTLRRRRRRVIATVAAATMLVGCEKNPDAPYIAQYNRGTTLLAHDSLTAGVPPLDSAARTPTPLLHFQAAFNSGWSYLTRARAMRRSDSANAVLDTALAHYRVALITTPGDLDAKWNYELSLHAKKSGGGGGGGGNKGGGGGQTPRPTPAPSAGLGQRQAQALLDNAERREHEVQGDKQRQNVPRPPPQGKDW